MVGTCLYIIYMYVQCPVSGTLGGPPAPGHGAVRTFYDLSAHDHARTELGWFGRLPVLAPRPTQVQSQQLRPHAAALLYISCMACMTHLTTTRLPAFLMYI